MYVYIGNQQETNWEPTGNQLQRGWMYGYIGNRQGTDGEQMGNRQGTSGQGTNAEPTPIRLDA
jgi:hypothetical protein